jgi:putative ABC transport system ATP-binding protein
MTPKSSTPILQTDHLSRSANGKNLVADVTIQVEKGDVMAVVGPSGSGKTSFLRLLNRLDEPTNGTVLLEGRDYKTIPPRELRQRVGMVMQTPVLLPGTVEDNIRFGPQQKGEEIPAETVDRLLSRVGLSGYAGQDINHLSGGEAQRVSLARTLANSPQVLLLDEPTSSLDDATERDAEALILNIIREQGLTCLIVTHDKAQATRMANKVMVLEKGQLTKIGLVEEILDAKPNLQ